MQRQKIKDLAWMQKFRFSVAGPICMKTALLKGDKIGYQNAAGDVFYTNPVRRVIPVNV